jgi:hypothetical protein
MRRFASLVALLLLFSAAAPMLACVTGRAMTREENACCRAMHGECGNMAQMGCCRKEIKTDDHPQLLTAAPSVPIQWIILAVIAPTDIFQQRFSPALFKAPEEHSPPGLVIVRTTNLRI